jgi:hypothetical protein
MKTISSDAFPRFHPTSAARHDSTTMQFDGWLLVCGILSGILYPTADIVAALRYPGFSYTDQAVSELFAIGAPTATLVVVLFSISTALLLPLALGIWRSAPSRRVVRFVAIMLVLHALDALALWNFFPMHMRGQQPTFTDTMHGLLAIDPFFLAVMIAAAVAWKGRFRVYTIATIVAGALLASYGLRFIPAVIANEPTPYMGLAERAGHYLNNLWFVVLSVRLLRITASQSTAARSPG